MSEWVDCFWSEDQIVVIFEDSLKEEKDFLGDPHLFRFDLRKVLKVVQHNMIDGWKFEKRRFLPDTTQEIVITSCRSMNIDDLKTEDVEVMQKKKFNYVGEVHRLSMDNDKPNPSTQTGALTHKGDHIWALNTPNGKIVLIQMARNNFLAVQFYTNEQHNGPYKKLIGLFYDYYVSDAIWMENFRRPSNLTDLKQDLK